MDLKQLRYFTTVAEEGTISAAAKKLFMSQPPLSTQMKLLEQKRVLSIYPDLVRQFLKGKPEHWKDFAFTMYSMETGIQKKYWKYVTGLFEEKKDDNK